MTANIDCPQSLQLLKSDYLDDELDAATRAQLDRHLEICAACRGVKEKIEALLVPLRSATRETPPPGLWPRIQSELCRQNPRNTALKIVRQVSLLEFFFMRPVFAAAAAAILILVSTVCYLRLPRPPGGASAPDLSSLTGDIEIHEASMGFGSNIELFLL